MRSVRFPLLVGAVGLIGSGALSGRAKFVNGERGSASLTAGGATPTSSPALPQDDPSAISAAD